MKILLKVKTRQTKDDITPDPSEPGTFLVKTKSPPVDDKANLAVISLCSAYFSVPQTRIHIVKGRKSKSKIIEISSI